MKKFRSALAALVFISSFLSLSTVYAGIGFPYFTVGKTSNAASKCTFIKKDVEIILEKDSDMMYFSPRSKAETMERAAQVFPKTWDISVEKNKNDGDEGKISRIAVTAEDVERVLTSADIRFGGPESTGAHIGVVGADAESARTNTVNVAASKFPFDSPAEASVSSTSSPLRKDSISEDISSYSMSADTSSLTAVNDMTPLSVGFSKYENTGCVENLDSGIEKIDETKEFAEMDAEEQSVVVASKNDVGTEVRVDVSSDASPESPFASSRPVDVEAYSKVGDDTELLELALSVIDNYGEGELDSDMFEMDASGLPIAEERGAPPALDEGENEVEGEGEFIESPVESKKQSGKRTSVDTLAAYISAVRPNKVVSTEEALEISEAAHKYAEVYNLPLGLVVGIMQTESNFRPSAVSGAGARGLMQVMWKYHHARLKVHAGFKNRDQLHDIDMGIRAGCLVLSKYVEAEKSITRALGRYYGALSRQYVSTVKSYWETYELVASGMLHEDEWKPAVNRTRNAFSNLFARNQTSTSVLAKQAKDDSSMKVSVTVSSASGSSSGKKTTKTNTTRVGAVSSKELIAVEADAPKPKKPASTQVYISVRREVSNTASDGASPSGRRSSTVFVR